MFTTRSVCFKEILVQKLARNLERGCADPSEDVYLQLPSFGVDTGQCPYVSSEFPRWREVVVFANKQAFPPRSGQRWCRRTTEDGDEIAPPPYDHRRALGKVLL